MFRNDGDERNVALEGERAVRGDELNKELAEVRKRIRELEAERAPLLAKLVEGVATYEEVTALFQIGMIIADKNQRSQWLILEAHKEIRKHAERDGLILESFLEVHGLTEAYAAYSQKAAGRWEKENAPFVH